MLSVGRAWLKARLPAGRIGFFSFPPNPGKLLDPVKNIWKGRGEDLGEDQRFFSAQERSHLPWDHIPAVS